MKSLCLCNIQSHLKQLNNLVTRESPSEEHAQALKSFDQVRMKFSRAYMVFMLLQSLAWLAADSFFTEHSREFAKSNIRQYDRELVDTLFPYLEWALYGMLILRSLLLAGSFKYPALTKFFFVHTMIYYCLSNTLPQNYGRFQVEIAVAQSLVIYFAFGHASYWFNMLSAIALTTYISLVVEHFIWQEQVKLGTWILCVFYQIVIFTGMHCFINLSSLLYAEAEILRKGNERLLDNFEEGVVILEEGTGNVSFANKSAKAFKVAKNPTGSVIDPEKSSQPRHYFGQFDRTAK